MRLDYLWSRPWGPPSPRAALQQRKVCAQYLSCSAARLLLLLQGDSQHFPGLTGFVVAPSPLRQCHEAPKGFLWDSRCSILSLLLPWLHPSEGLLKHLENPSPLLPPDPPQPKRDALGAGSPLGKRKPVWHSLAEMGGHGGDRLWELSSLLAFSDNRSQCHFPSPLWSFRRCQDKCHSHRRGCAAR